MQLLDHVSITVRSLERVKTFYIGIMSSLGAIVAYERADAVGFGERNRPGDDVHTYLTVYQSAAASADSRRHWCFRAASAEQVDAFHAAGRAAGGDDAGPPGPRSYHPGYYAAFLLDPEGNKVEAVYHHHHA